MTGDSAELASNNSLSLDDAPLQLRSLVEEFHIEEVDYREATRNGQSDGGAFGGGCYWRLVFTKAILEAHITEFHLEPTQPGARTAKMLQRIPSGWPELSDPEWEWFAFPYNRDDSDRLQYWAVMVVDRENSLLYFFFQNYDVTG